MQMNEFCDWLKTLRAGRILELGTCRSDPQNPTHHRSWAAQDAVYIMSDFQNGLDVNIVADAHTLTSTFETESFDAIIACSVFEYIQRPWIAAQEIAKLLKPTGKAFIQTHQSFPLHGYPSDYWRFSADALETIFGDVGLKGKGYYEFPCQIFSKQVPGSENFEAFLNVCITVEQQRSVF
jgi:SAM-dependent methyltransferase